MKALIAVIRAILHGTILMIGTSTIARGELLVADDFTYPNGGLNGHRGGKGFSDAWTSTIEVRDGVVTGNSASTRHLATPFAASGTLWLSFDWAFASNPHPQAQFGGITFFKGNEERHLIGDVWDTGVWSSSGAAQTSISNFGEMKRGVAKITLAPAGASTVELWVGPQEGVIDASSPPIATSTGRNLEGVDTIRIMGSSFDANVVQNFDNLLIGTSAADVNATSIAASWKSATGGVWGEAANWEKNQAPAGRMGTVDFTTTDLTAHATVELDLPASVTELVWGDADVSTAASWKLIGKDLTLVGSKPTITVNAMGEKQLVAVSAIIGGQAGLTKAGAGTLVLVAENRYSGKTQITAGTLQIGLGGTSGTLGLGPVEIASGASLVIDRSDAFALTTTQALVGEGYLVKQGQGVLTLTGSNTYRGGTAIKSGTLALQNQAALGEGSLEIARGAKVALNFIGTSSVTSLTLAGIVQAEGSYGSTKSTAQHQNDEHFSGTGVIQVSAKMDHPAAAAVAMQKADAAWAEEDWSQVRDALTPVIHNLRLAPQWRSIADLRYARSYQAEGDFIMAQRRFRIIAENTAYPRVHRIEGAECQIECERLAQGKPARDPEASRVRVPAAPLPGRTLYIATDGKDSNPGTRAQPFATMARALAANRAAGPVAGGTTILMAPGRYPLRESIQLTEADGGTGSDAPLVIRAAQPGSVILSGGQRLSGFTTVKNPAVLARLPQEARGKVLECSLAALGIKDYGSIQEQPMVNLSVNGVLQTLSRWPNSGFVRVGEMIDNGNIDPQDPSKNRPQVFTTSDRIARWLTAKDAWLQGYLPTNWMYGSVPVGAFDAKTKSITTAWCYNRLSGWPDIKSGHPYAIFNLLEEMDQPGEWYLDRAQGMLYLYPSVLTGKAEVELSMLPTTMLTANQVSHVRLEGLIFEGGRAAAVDFENCRHCLIAGCTIRNMSGVGVRINGGQRNAMIGCDLHDLEQGGCYLNGGGENDSLVPAGHEVVNCRFRHFGISRINSAGIDIGGVGNRIAHCSFEDCPSSAIIFHGNNLRVEYNEFRNCCNENEDYGVIYAWGNPIWRGNLWRFNKFSHCGGGYTQGWVQNRHFGTSCFRFDDAVSGQMVYGNVMSHFDIWGTSAGVMSNNCGGDNHYDNNLVTDSPGMNAGYYNGGNIGGVPYQVSAYLEAFPELVRLFDGQVQNGLWRSFALRVPVKGTNAQNASYSDRDWGGWQYIGNTSSDTDLGIMEGVEVKKHIDPKIFWKLGMRAIPVEEIGLYDDPTRQAWKEDYGVGKKVVFAAPGGSIQLKAPLVADGLTFNAPGYSIQGNHAIIFHGQESSIDAKTFDATIGAPIMGLGGLSVSGSSTLTLSARNGYRGDTNIKNGALALSGGENRLPPGTTVTLGSGGPASVGTLKLNGCDQELAGLWTAGHNSDPGNRVINGSAAPCTLTLNIEYSRNNQFVGSLGGPGVNENNFALRKIGPGSLWLNRSMLWTGGTTIEEGTLELNSSFWAGNRATGVVRIGKGATFAVSGQMSPLTFQDVTIEFLPEGGGTLVNKGSSDWLTWQVDGAMTIRSLGGARNVFSAAPNFGISLNGKNVLCDIARGKDPSCDLLVSLPLSGEGSLIKEGAGIMVLSAANSYSGPTTVKAGKLFIDAAAKLGDGPLTVEKGATCVLRNPAGSLADAAVVTLQVDAKIELAEGVTETVGSLVIDGKPCAAGLWNAVKLPAHIRGKGSLRVVTGP